MAHDFEDIVIFPQGGLNWDDDLLMLPPADARRRENVIISDRYNHNIFTNVKGNTFKNDAVGGGTFTYPSGNCRVIGFVENKEDQAGIFFVYSDVGHHSIIQYRAETDDLEYIIDGSQESDELWFTGVHFTPANSPTLVWINPIFPPNLLVGLTVTNVTDGSTGTISANTSAVVTGTLSGGTDDDWDVNDVFEINYWVGGLLDFQENGYVDAGVIGTGSEKYLTWTHPDGTPMILNIETALAGGYTTMTKTTLMLYKRPYLDYFNVTFQSVANQTNMLRGWLWQFSVRIKYIDKTFSALSPYSPIPIPDEDEYMNGVVVEDDNNNRIQLQINDLEDDNIVEYQLAFRKIDIESGAASNWYLNNEPFSSSGGTYVLLFRGDVDAVLLDPDYAAKIQDWVPIMADHLGIIDSNRIVLGDITEGFDNIDSSTLDITLSTQAATVPTYDEDHDEGVNSGATPDTVTVPFSSGVLNYYKVFVNSTKTPYLKSYTYYEPATKQEVGEWIRDVINNDFTATVTVDGSYNLVITGDAGNTTYVYIGAYGENFQVPVFKTNANHLFGLVYIYNGRYGYVQKNDDCIINIPHDGTGNWDSANNIRIEIDHTPPVDATHFQVAYLGSDIDYFEEYLLEVVHDGDGNIQDSYMIDVEGDYLKLHRTRLLSVARGAYGDAIDYGFDIQKGDVVYFKAFHTALPPSAQDLILVAGGADDLDAWPTLFQTPVLEVTTTYITIQNILADSSFFPDTISYIVIQIYRRKDIAENSEYQLIPGVFEILPGDYTDKFHEGNTQDQDSGNPAIIDITDFGDCFYTNRIWLNDLNYGGLHYDDLYTNGMMGWLWSVSEQKNFSLMYPSRMDNFGKVNYYNEFAAQIKFHNIRWGGKFTSEVSGVNFFSSFDALDYKEMDERNGDINRIQQIGDTLKVYQERKINSLYLKTTSSTSADGSQTYVFSDNVMSDVRQSVMDYGLTHFSSYVKTVRTAFGVDFINATVWKDTPGGVIPIGDIRMQTYFREKVDEINGYGYDNVEIYGGYDEYLDMYLVTFQSDSYPAVNETLGFREGNDRWISFYSYVPEFYGKISGKTALTFNDGDLYLQNDNSLRNNFFGVQYDSRVDVASKGNPGDIKIWDSIEIHSTAQWSPNQDRDVVISIPIAMWSKIPADHFQLQEGVYYSEFLRDASDGEGALVFTRDHLHNGRQLRGSEMIVILRNDDTSEANLRLVKIKGTISR